jgi:outer membrane protein insertion porin family
LNDDIFVGAGLVTALAARNFPEVNNFGSLFLTNGGLATTYQYNDACNLVLSICTVPIPPGFQQVFLRGEAQTNRLLEVNNAAFDSFADYRASVGMELRVQVPVVNVPFRLIYYYNPNAKIGQFSDLPGLNLPGKRSGFRFTVGRTF